MKNVEQLVKNTYEELIKFKDEFQHRSDLLKPSKTTDLSNKLSPNLEKQSSDNVNIVGDITKPTSNVLSVNSKLQKKSEIGDKKPPLIRNTTVNRTFLLRRTLSEKSFNTGVKNTSSVNRLDTKKVTGTKGNKVMKPKTLVGQKKPLQSFKNSQDMTDNDDQIDITNKNKTLYTKNKSRIPFQEEETKENEIDTVIQDIDLPRINTPSDVSLDQDYIKIAGKANHSSVQKPGLPEAEETPRSITAKKDVEKLTLVNLNDTFCVEPELPSNLPSPIKSQHSLGKGTSDINLVSTGIQCSNLDEMLNKNKLTVQILPKIDIKRALVTQKIPILVIEPEETVVDIKKPDNIGYMEVVHGSAKASAGTTQAKTIQQLTEHHEYTEINTTLYKDLPNTTPKNMLAAEENIPNTNLQNDFESLEQNLEQINTNNESILKQNQDILENRCATIKKRLEAMRQYKFQSTLYQNIEVRHTENQESHDLIENESNSSTKEDNIQTSTTLKQIQSRLENQCATIKTRLAEQRKINFADALNLRRELTLPPRWQNKTTSKSVVSEDTLKSKSISRENIESVIPPKRDRMPKKVDNSKEEVDENIISDDKRLQKNVSYGREYNAAISSEKADSYATSSAFMSEHSTDSSSNHSHSTSGKIQSGKVKESTSNISSAKENDTSITAHKPVLKESEIILAKLLQKYDKPVVDQLIQTERIFVNDQNTQYSLQSSSNTDVNASQNIASPPDTKLKRLTVNITELEKNTEIRATETEKDKNNKSEKLKLVESKFNETELISEKPGVLKLPKSANSNVYVNKRVHFETVTTQFCISPDEKLAEDFKNNIENDYALEEISQDIKTKESDVKQTMVTEDELEEYNTSRINNNIQTTSTDRIREISTTTNENGYSLQASNAHKSCQHDDGQNGNKKKMDEQVFKETSTQYSPPLLEQPTHPVSNLKQSKTVPIDIRHTVNKPSTSYEQEMTGPHGSAYLKLLDSYKLQSLNSARFKKDRVYSKYKKSSTPLVSSDTATTDTEGTSLSEGEVKLPCKCSISIGEIHLCRFANDIKRKSKIMKQNPETLVTENTSSVSDYKQYENWLAYMSKSENTISGDTNSYISSITSNFTSETGS